MTLYSIYEKIQPYMSAQSWLIVLLILTYLIDISKIQLNPWKWVGKLIRKGLRDLGSVLTEDVRTELSTFKEQYDTGTKAHVKECMSLYDKLDNLEKNISTVNEQLNNHIAESLRRDILDFQNSCINKRRHTKEEWTYVYKVCDKYEKHIEANHLKNSEAEEAIAYIRHVYRECLEDGDFLLEQNLAR